MSSGFNSLAYSALPSLKSACHSFHKRGVQHTLDGELSLLFKGYTDVSDGLGLTLLYQPLPLKSDELIVSNRDYLKTQKEIHTPGADASEGPDIPAYKWVMFPSPDEDGQAELWACEFLEDGRNFGLQNTYTTGRRAELISKIYDVLQKYGLLRTLGLVAFNSCQWELRHADMATIEHREPNADHCWFEDSVIDGIHDSSPVQWMFDKKLGRLMPLVFVTEDRIERE